MMATTAIDNPESTPYNGLYGEASPRRDTFLEGRNFSGWSIYKCREICQFGL